MKTNLFKGLGVLAAMAFFASPFALSASHSCGCQPIKPLTYKDVAGTYQLNGFSNSLDGSGTLLQPQSQAAVGQATFNKDGTGNLNFIEFVVIVNDNITRISRTDVPFTYSLESGNGFGTVTIQDFPAPGLNPKFALSFKRHKGKVKGFSQVTIENPGVPSTARWTLLQGKRYS